MNKGNQIDSLDRQTYLTSPKPMETIALKSRIPQSSAGKEGENYRENIDINRVPE